MQTMCLLVSVITCSILVSGCATSQQSRLPTEVVTAEAGHSEDDERIRDEDLVIIENSGIDDRNQWQCERRAPVGSRVKETECSTGEQRQLDKRVP